jgi:uncharacterized protein
MNRWALITGASSGIGLELSKLFARDGWNVVLTARNEPRLRELANELEQQHCAKSKIIAEDLSLPGAADRLFAATRELPISALVNNAGFGHYGDFANSPAEVHQSMIQVNVSALVDLTHLFLPGMLARRQGIILNVGSVAAFQPGPTVNVYYATKAFVYSFTYALAMELKGSGVTATVLNPGTTRTEFFQRAKIHMSRPFPLMDPQQVALVGYRAAMSGSTSATPGLVNRIISVVSPCLPSRLTAGVVARIHARRPPSSE